MKTSTRAPRQQRGFTLVELLIVVLILGILAGVVIPTFQDHSQDAKESALAGNLAAIRSAIALYRVQHNEEYPGTVSGITMQEQLMGDTHADGTDGGGAGLYGPYLRGEDEFPENPFSNLNTVSVVTTMPASPSGVFGYVYSTTTGELRCDNLGNAPSGTAFFDL